jgi:hypothetical protein
MAAPLEPGIEGDEGELEQAAALNPNATTTATRRRDFDMFTLLNRSPPLGNLTIIRRCTRRASGFLALEAADRVVCGNRA